MREKPCKFLEAGRVTDNEAFESNAGSMTGAFYVRRNSILIFALSTGNADLKVDSELFHWEHVSVSLPRQRRCPTWPEMCFIKDLFWDEEETVIQYHPKKSDYVNIHPFVLHLWKPAHIAIPMPPKGAV